MTGMVVRQFPELTPELRFLKIPKLKLDCQLVVNSRDISGRARKLASKKAVRQSKHLGDGVQIIVNDIPTFAAYPYTYRKAMMDYYIKDSEVLIKNPVLFSGYDIGAVEFCADWARENDKDGIQIIFHDYPYVYTETTNMLFYRTKINE